MNQQHREELLSKLEGISRLAKGSKLNRFIANPVIYVAVMIFNKFIYPISKKGRLVRANTFFGSKMDLLLPSGTDIKLLGAKSDDSEIRLAKYLVKNIREGQVFLDIGAHLGFYSQLAAYLTGEKGTVVAIEASEHTFSLLKNNLRAYSQIQCYHLAAGDKAGEIEFTEFPVLYSEYNTMNPDQFKDQSWYRKLHLRSTKVRMVRMDEWLKDSRIQPDFIKIDAEGAEDKVILGLSDFLLNFGGGLILEFLGDQRSNEPHLSALKHLLDLGYLPYSIDEQGNTVSIDSVTHYFTAKQLDSDNLLFARL